MYKIKNLYQDIREIAHIQHDNHIALTPHLEESLRAKRYRLNELHRGDFIVCIETNDKCYNALYNGPKENLIAEWQHKITKQYGNVTFSHERINRTNGYMTTLIFTHEKMDIHIQYEHYRHAEIIVKPRPKEIVAICSL